MTQVRFTHYALHVWRSAYRRSHLWRPADRRLQLAFVHSWSSLVFHRPAIQEHSGPGKPRWWDLAASARMRLAGTLPNRRLAPRPRNGRGCRGAMSQAKPACLGTSAAIVVADMSASYAEVDCASASSRAAAGVPAAAGWRQRTLLSSCVSWLVCGLQDVVSVGCQTSRPLLRRQSIWRASVISYKLFGTSALFIILPRKLYFRLGCGV